MPDLVWHSANEVSQRQYRCGFCASLVGSSRGYKSSSGDIQINICPFCDYPTLFRRGGQLPTPAFGNEVQNLPPQVAGAYREARNCMSVTAFTAAALLCRKLLMHVAASHGAPAGRSFAVRGPLGVESPDTSNRLRVGGPHAPQGNEATHEIPEVARADAEELITFCEMLLKLVYEFPSRRHRHAQGAGLDEDEEILALLGGVGAAGCVEGCRGTR
jgi:hypothetical protein